MQTFFKKIVIVILFLGSFCIGCQSETSRKIQNIETFARLYGYARWFHPSDEAQEIDWDKFAVLGVQKVENIQSTKELRDTLYQLFSPFVQGLKIYETKKPETFNQDMLISPDEDAKPVAWQHLGVYLNDKSNIYKSVRTNKKSYAGKYGLDLPFFLTGRMFEKIPQFGEMINEPIGNDLTCAIPLVLQTNDTATYPKSDISSLILLKSEIDSIIMDGEFNMQVNLGGVVIAWNVLQHFFPYFDVIDTDWNKVLGETLDSALENKQKKDYFITMSQMFAKISDGHGIVSGEKRYSLPIRTEFIENHFVITASSHSLLKRGDIIKKVDGKSALAELENKEKMISGSPQLRRHRALNIWGGKFNASDTELVIERDGQEQNITVSNSSPGNMFFNPIDDRKYLSETIVEIEPGIYYVNMTNCTENHFDQNIDELANAKAVIYDQRGGSRLQFFHIAPYLIEEPVNSAWWNVPQTIYPDRKEVEFTKSNWNIQPKQPLFKSKTIIINVPAVVSAGETMMGIIDHYNLATTVGETTAGCNGNVNVIKLPYGYTAWFTGMKVLKHDGTQLYIEGFEPDYPVTKTIQAIKEGRDEYLEKALEIARN